MGEEPPAHREVARALVVRPLDAVLGHARVGEHADQEPPGQSREPVGVDHPEGVVDLGEGTALREEVPS